MSQQRARKQLLKLGFAQVQEVTLRLIRVRLPNGKWEVLATSLLDQKRYPACAFAALYGQRWGVEEAFKLAPSTAWIWRASAVSCPMPSSRRFTPRR